MKKITINDLFEKGVKLQGLNSVEDNGEIKEMKSLMVNLHKSKTKDHNEKDIEIQGSYWSLTGAKLHKIKSLKSIRNVIKRNQKSND